MRMVDVEWKKKSVYKCRVVNMKHFNAVWFFFHELIKYAWEQDVSFLNFKKPFFAYNCWPFVVNLLCDPQL